MYVQYDSTAGHGGINTWKHERNQYKSSKGRTNEGGKAQQTSCVLFFQMQLAVEVVFSLVLPAGHCHAGGGGGGGGEGGGGGGGDGCGGGGGN